MGIIAVFTKQKPDSNESARLDGFALGSTSHLKNYDVSEIVDKKYEEYCKEYEEEHGTLSYITSKHNFFYSKANKNEIGSLIRRLNDKDKYILRLNINALYSSIYNLSNSSINYLPIISNKINIRVSSLPVNMLNIDRYKNEEVTEEQYCKWLLYGGLSNLGTLENEYMKASFENYSKHRKTLHTNAVLTADGLFFEQQDDNIGEWIDNYHNFIDQHKDCYLTLYGYESINKNQREIIEFLNKYPELIVQPDDFEPSSNWWWY